MMTKALHVAVYVCGATKLRKTHNIKIKNIDVVDFFHLDPTHKHTHTRYRHKHSNRINTIRIPYSRQNKLLKQFIHIYMPPTYYLLNTHSQYRDRIQAQRKIHWIPMIWIIPMRFGLLNILSTRISACLQFSLRVDRKIDSFARLICENWRICEHWKSKGNKQLTVWYELYCSLMLFTNLCSKYAFLLRHNVAYIIP